MAQTHRWFCHDSPSRSGALHGASFSLLDPGSVTREKKKVKFPRKQVMRKHRNARGTPVWRQAAKPRLGKETWSRKPKIVSEMLFITFPLPLLFSTCQVPWGILPPSRAPGALGCHLFPRRRFSNTPYSAPALQLMNAAALDLQVKCAYKLFTNHPNDLTGFVMSMDSSGTSVLVTFRSAGKQK